MLIKRFEDIEAWQAARTLTKLAYEATRLQAFEDDWDLRRQVRRAAGSAMANIAEGFDSGSDREFRRYLRIARRSCNELKSHLYTALDQGYLEQKVFTSLYDRAEDARRMIGGFIRYLDACPKKTRRSE